MAKPRAKKVLKIVLVVLAVIVVFVLIGGCIFYRDLTRGPLPQHNGELQVAGLCDKVEILRDKWGVPQIYASNMHDLFFAQGYTQAQDRWWQMELYRHYGSGRLEELTGKINDILEVDMFIRTLGWRQVAEQEFELLDNETKASLRDFADGVNAYIMSRNSGDLAVEYGVLSLTGRKIKVEPWTPADTLVFAKVMAWGMGPGNEILLRNEEQRATLYELMGQEMTDQWLTPPWPFGEKPTICQPEDLNTTESTVNTSDGAGNDAGIVDGHTLASRDALPDMSSVFGDSGGAGSNNWVVSGNMTASGMPLLAMDPMLNIEMPSTWYEIGLHCQSASDQCSYDVTGFTFAIMPGIIIGHNNSIAWGVTNNGSDVFDLYKIRANPDNPFQYEWNGAWRDMTVRQETIRFAGSGETITFQVRETHLGPIINDNKLDEETGEIAGFNNEDPVALRWTALDPSTLFRAILPLNRAGNWEKFRSALEYWDVPSQNFVYADMNGNIGYQMPGRIPIRAENHSGLLPVPGWTDEFEWQGFIPYESLPNIFNPKRGYIATANQAVVPPEYYDKLAQELGEGRNYEFSQEWDYGYRAQRIVELLKDYAPHTIESFQRIQGDNKSISAEELMPYIANLYIDDPELAGARDWLLTWDYQFDVDSSQAALYAEFWTRLIDNLFNDQLSRKQLEDSTISSELLLEIEAYGFDPDMRAAFLLMQQPDNAWWDDVTTENVAETRDDILLRSFQEAYKNTISDLGRDRGKWKWGDLHKATFVSLPLGESGVGIIEHMFNRGPFSVGGSTATINDAQWSVQLSRNTAKSRDFAMYWMPDMRMILDLGNLTRSVSINSSGQSGHPYSDNYSDMIEPWRNIEYHPMLWTREQVEASAVERLILNPSQPQQS